MTSTSIAIVNGGGPFLVFMQSTPLHVAFVPKESVELTAWWIMREYGFMGNVTKSNGFSSLSLDNDGMTVICNSIAAEALQQLNPTGVKHSSSTWKAFVINVIGSATEVPGAICYLADKLAKENISILHVSTYQSEVFLVQENDVDKASTVFKSCDSVKQLSEFITSLSDSGGNNNNNNNNCNTNVTNIRDGFELQILPNHVVLSRLCNNQSSMEQIAPILIRLALFDSRYCNIEKNLSAKKTVKKDQNSDSSESNDESNGIQQQQVEEGNEIPFLWMICKCDDEITLLLHGDDYKLFPSGFLAISPQPWKIIKLGGRKIGYDEVGIVAAMSRMEVNVSTLNLSTADSNYALVPNEQLESATKSLSWTLNATVKQLSNISNEQ